MRAHRCRCASAIFSRCSGGRVRPLWAAASFARVSSDAFFPICAAAIFAFVSVLRLLPKTEAVRLAIASEESVFPRREAAIFWICSDVRLLAKDLMCANSSLEYSRLHAATDIFARVSGDLLRAACDRFARVSIDGLERARAIFSRVAGVIVTPSPPSVALVRSDPTMRKEAMKYRSSICQKSSLTSLSIFNRGRNPLFSSDAIQFALSVRVLHSAALQCCTNRLSGSADLPIYRT